MEMNQQITTKWQTKKEQLKGLNPGNTVFPCPHEVT